VHQLAQRDCLVAPFAEKSETLRSEDLELRLTNRGAGISEAVLLKHAMENGQPVILNSADRTPIGAIVEHPENPSLPEFAVEAVIAWHRDIPLMTANFTGALRLLTGLGWPMIYAVAAYFYRRKTGRRMGAIQLADEHCVEVVGLFAALAWGFVIWIKGTLDLIDAGILIAVYCAYLWVLRHMPSADKETIEELERETRNRGGPAEMRIHRAGCRA
jgi:hypothetical protein